MSSRFNLRARKSLKLFGQSECTSCHRFYFPPENSDDENDNGTQATATETLCCDCEEKKRHEPPPKRRAVQRQNGASPSISNVYIKQEKPDLDDSQSIASGHFDQRLSNVNQHAKNRTENTNCDQMVQIHSSELLPLNTNSKY